MSNGQGEKIYLAGPMSGIHNHNKAEFMKWEAKLKTTGAEVFNPIMSPASRLVQTGILTGQDAYRRCLALDLKYICEEATSIFMLRGWEGSPGARAEHATASALGLMIHYET